LISSPCAPLLYRRIRAFRTAHLVQLHFSPPPCPIRLLVRHSVLFPVSSSDEASKVSSVSSSPRIQLQTLAPSRTLIDLTALTCAPPSPPSLRIPGVPDQVARFQIFIQPSLASYPPPPHRPRGVVLFSSYVVFPLFWFVFFAALPLLPAVLATRFISLPTESPEFQAREVPPWGLSVTS